jgi:hypothetical protein
MRSPDHQDLPEQEDSAPRLADSPEADSRQEGETFSEWVALVVLLACWLAEACL